MGGSVLLLHHHLVGTARQGPGVERGPADRLVGAEHAHRGVLAARAARHVHVRGGLDPGPDGFGVGELGRCQRHLGDHRAVGELSLAGTPLDPPQRRGGRREQPDDDAQTDGEQHHDRAPARPGGPEPAPGAPRGEAQSGGGHQSRSLAARGWALASSRTIRPSRSSIT
ncbi:hypothetical protein SDC9_120571 [bioreactor metagenome]|uniref:Uncharacterized protein n=1 Tax=bioreactor metagenome TaxID=1076179 RepID=A0A645C7H2_9ZZZZ